MNKILAIVTATVLLGGGWADIIAHAQQAQSTAAGARNPEDILITAADIDRDLKIIFEHIRQDVTGKKPLLPTAFRGYALTVKQYYDHPSLEEKTEYSKAWIGKLMGSLNEMFKAKFTAKIAHSNRNREQFDVAVTQYKEQCVKFNELLKNPEKIEKQTRRRR